MDERCSLILVLFWWRDVSFVAAFRDGQEIKAIKQQLSDEPLQGGQEPLPYGQRARVTPERLAFVIREQWRTFNQVTGQARGVMPPVGWRDDVSEYFTAQCRP